jgi:alanyl-tRNA synthetase
MTRLGLLRDSAVAITRVTRTRATSSAPPASLGAAAPSRIGRSLVAMTLGRPAFATTSSAVASPSIHRARSQRANGRGIAVRVMSAATERERLTNANPNARGKDNSGAAIRQRFLKFYETRGHAVLPSSSLVPEDPTVLLTIAGMLQFKPVFMGQRERAHERATTTQKCVRTNDIENVGVTARHHTFFEMLGNFSFGDYFKKDACQWAWELATGEFGLNPERVWVSVFREDDEAFAIWRDVVGVPESRIKRMDEKDNFWAAGPTGPCGPCSELYYDFHPERGLEGADLDDDSRFIEFYNLVFMELNRDADGGVTPLKNKNIDTGMGLERMAQILQGVPNNYETDLIMPIINKAASMAGIDYNACNDVQKQQLKVIGDHTRAVSYMISDGVFASNIGRGYIVRRLLRRVVRNGRLLGIKPEEGASAFTPAIAEVAISMSEGCDPQVAKNSARILAELEREELSFQKTLGRGEEMLAELIETAKKTKTGLSGKDAFTLYDTYGFPLDITTDVATEAGITVDLEGFESAMAEQRSMSQAAHQTVDVTVGNALARVADELGAKSTFIGYESTSSDVSNVLAIVCGGESVEEAPEGAKVDIVLDVTPFYAESGGQVGDNGVLHTADGATLEVSDVQKAGGGRIIVHTATVTKGSIKKGSQVTANVDENSRRRAKSNHTATHLLQSALKKVLGEDVSQAGSLCGFDRLRFDFNSPKAPTEAQLLEVENLVNGWISQSAALTAEEMPIAAAKDKGATMMFGEKYGDVVRVVDVPGISMELCGGTHVSNTAEIGGFKILSEAGIASGIRRIEAVAGAGVVELLQQRDAVVKQLASALRVPPEEITGRVSSLQEDLRATQKLAESLRGELAVAKAGALVSQAREVGEAKVLVARLDGVDPAALKVAAENLAAQLGDGAAIVLGSANGANVGLVALFDDKVQKDGGLKAGQVLGAAAKKCGGGGGGKPGFAQAGGRDATQLDTALDEALATVTAALSPK